MVRRAWVSLALVPGMALLACGPPGPAKPADPGGATPADTAVVVPVPETSASAAEQTPPPSSTADAPAIPFRPMVVAGPVEPYIQKLRSDPAGPGAASQDGGVDYQDGLSAERGSRSPEARKSYLRLIQQYPSSPFIAAAYFGFGEMFYNEAKSDPAKTAIAEQSYKEVLKYPAPQNLLLAAAKYRLGLTLQKSSPAQALAAFSRAAKADLEPNKSGCAVEIAAAAASASTAVFADVGDPAKSWDFYIDITRDGARAAARTLELAQRYIDGKKLNDAAVSLGASVELGARSQPDAAARTAYCAKAKAAADTARASAPGGALPNLDRAMKAACP